MPILLRNPLDPAAPPTFPRVIPSPQLVVDAIIAVAFRRPIGNGFISPKVKKGRLTNLLTKRAHYFMFNPTEINRTDGWGWSSHRVPGASHPVVTGGTGGDRKISFTLYFDAERGRADNRREQIGDFSLDLTEELNAWRAMTYPQAPSSNTLPNRGPARFMLTYGTMFSGIEVVVDSVNINVMSMTPNLSPMRASVSIELTEFVRKSVFSNDETRLPSTVGVKVFDVGTAIVTPTEAFDVVQGSEIDNGGTR